MLVLVVYDVPDDRRRVKLATFLEGYGRRVQYSVFECFLNLDEMRQLHEKVRRRVKSTEDNVRFYWISEEAVSRVLTIGSSPPQEPPQAYII
ncbi:MAG: CRISPR-associated endonuclease Cas2 [Trichocoleus desertorum ATA4-8-CV12]|jgi:CRISPR-associated protein Cas2|nr:CRISPR-associated endonuclease Cas2 [Trichocoleus desertorum ATA4-8-CV12]